MGRTREEEEEELRAWAWVVMTTQQIYADRQLGIAGDLLCCGEGERGGSIGEGDAWYFWFRVPMKRVVE